MAVNTADKTKTAMDFPLIGDLYRRASDRLLYMPVDWAEDTSSDKRGTLVLCHTVDDPGRQLAIPLAEWNEKILSGFDARKKIPCQFEHEPMTDKLAEELWDMLSDIPFYEGDPEDDLLLAKDWFIFFEFTPRESIWRWFDEHHSKGVHYLLYDRG